MIKNQDGNHKYAGAIHASFTILAIMTFQSEYLLTGMLPLIVPIGLWWLRGRTDSFVDWHGREAIRFILIWGIGIPFVLWGIAAALVSKELDYLTLTGTDPTQNDNLTYFVTILGLMRRKFSYGKYLVYLILVAQLFVVINPLWAAFQAFRGRYYVYPDTWSPRRAILARMLAEADSGTTDKTPEEAASVTQKVVVNCPSCASALRVSSGKSGKIRCPSCSTLFEASTKNTT